MRRWWCRGFANTALVELLINSNNYNSIEGTAPSQTPEVSYELVCTAVNNIIRISGSALGFLSYKFPVCDSISRLNITNQPVQLKLITNCY